MHRSNRLAYLNLVQLIIDFFFLILSYFVAYFISSKVSDLLGVSEYLWMIIIFIPIWLSFMAVLGMYNASTFNYYDRILRYELLSSVFSGGILVFIFFFIKDTNISRSFYLIFLIVSFSFTLAERYFLINFINKNRNIGAKNVVLVIAGDMYNQFEHFINRTSIRLNVIKQVDVDKDKPIKDNEFLGDREIFEKYLKENVVDEIIFGLPLEKYTEIEYLNDISSEMGITSRMLLNIHHKDYCNLYVSSLGTIPMVTVHSVSLNTLQGFLKRSIDIVGSLVGIILSIPICLVAGIAIKMESKGPVFFKQERVGRNGRRFKMYKLRSMSQDAEDRKKEILKENEVSSGLMFKMENDPRITKVGKFIRKTSIDELPQLINVLKGEMSLVGTRPPTIDEVEKYDPTHWRRISVKPGITGMWQVSGRSSIKDFDAVVKLDTKYINEWSVWLDIKIILKTFSVIFAKKGAY